MYRKHVELVIQIFTELAVRDGFAGLLVTRRDNAHVGRDRLRSANPNERSSLEHP